MSHDIPDTRTHVELAGQQSPPTAHHTVVLDDIMAARRRIQHHVKRTQTVSATRLGDLLGADLSEHGATRADIVKTTVFLSDLSLWTAMNEPYRAFFGDGPLPARSAVGVQLPEGVLVEIDAVAIADGASSHHGCEVDT